MAGGLHTLLDRYPALQEAGLYAMDLDDLRGGGYAPTQSPGFIKWQLAALDWADNHKGKAAGTDRRMIIQVGAYTQRVAYEGAQVLCFTAEQAAEALGIKPDTARASIERMTGEANGTPPLKRIKRGAPGLYGSIYAIAPFLEAQAKNPNSQPKSGFQSNAPNPRFHEAEPPNTPR